MQHTLLFSSFLFTPISAPLVMFVCLFTKGYQVAGTEQGIWTLQTSFLDLGLPFTNCVTPQTGH